MSETNDTFEAAEGFFELGLFADAWEELDKLQVADRIHPSVMQMRLDILLALERWEDAVALGTGCCKTWKDHKKFFSGTAKALIKLGDHGTALVLLRMAPADLQAQADYHYMMARCAALLGLSCEARLSLRECFNRQKSYREKCLDDPDFKALWESF